jgi:GNAT superfamily N-acetyltransferase
VEALGQDLRTATLPDLEIREAGEADLEQASAILVEAASWLIERGMPLWRPEELDPLSLRPRVAERSLHLARLRGEPAATVLYRRSDPLMWSDVDCSQSAFVHRLAVRRRFAGTGVAAGVLAWAAERARSEGCRWLRLDCSADHPGLCVYYQAAGFVRHSEGPYRTIRFQRALTGDGEGVSESE